MMSGSNKDINAELFNAVQNGKIDEVKSLISDGADVNAYDGSQGNSLYWAIKNDHLDIAKVLLDNGADFIAYDSSRERHVSNKHEEVEAEHCKVSLHLAAKLGDLQAVKTLANKGDVDVQNDKGETPLHFAALYGKEEVAALLLNKEANVNAKDQIGRTPLHFAALYGKEEVAALLLNKEANVNAKDQIGRTPLHFAALY
ncbi:MAG: ankyrin repeat domain-containing protein, partial [Wolbachia sp.]